MALCNWPGVIPVSQISILDAWAFESLRLHATSCIEPFCVVFEVVFLKKKYISKQVPIDFSGLTDCCFALQLQK